MWLNGVWLHHIVGINGLCEDIYLFHMLFSWDISQRNENHKRERKLTRKLNQFLVCHCKGCNESTNVLFRLFCWMLKPFIFNPKYLNMSLTNKLSHKIHYHLHFRAFILQYVVEYILRINFPNNLALWGQQKTLIWVQFMGENFFTKTEEATNTFTKSSLWVSAEMDMPETSPWEASGRYPGLMTKPPQLAHLAA